MNTRNFSAVAPSTISAPSASGVGRSMARPFSMVPFLLPRSSSVAPASPIVIQGNSFPDAVEVSLTDSGPGIAAELHNQIFELNFSRAGGHPGKLGFGLWWVKTLMTRLGGSVTVESDGVHGTTFRLRLPSVDVEHM